MSVTGSSPNHLAIKILLCIVLLSATVDAQCLQYQNYLTCYDSTYQYYYTDYNYNYYYSKSYSYGTYEFWPDDLVGASSDYSSDYYDGYYYYSYYYYGYGYYYTNAVGITNGARAGIAIGITILVLILLL